MSRHRNRDYAGRDGARRRAFQKIRCIRSHRAVLAMDPDARVKLLSVFFGVSNVVLMREENVRDAARVFEPLHELRRIARGIYEKVAACARGEVRMRAERRPCVEATAPHAVGHLLRKDNALRTRLFILAAY